MKFVVRLIAVGLTIPLAMHAQAITGGITGRVTAQATQQPIADAIVTVVGTRLGGTTGPDGRYRIANVPAGTASLRVQRLGFSPQTTSVTVENGVSTVNFVLTEVAAVLGTQVVTATGQRRKLEIGNDIAAVTADSIVQTAPISDINDLLTSRVAGVQVLSEGVIGSGAKVRLRGTNSASLSNDPVYYIDGVRLESESIAQSISVGGSAPSRVNDIDPEDIATFEVAKGPSASALYGTDAANGVIIITTKRGSPGAARWNLFTDQGANSDLNRYPTAWSGWDAGRRGCTLVFSAAGDCHLDSTTTFNLFDNKLTTPLATGYYQKYGVAVSGGAPIVRYYASGDYQTSDGVVHLPQFETERLAAEHMPLQDNWVRPNYLTAGTARANVDFDVAPNADFALSTNFVTREIRLPQTDNNTTGLPSNSFGGPGTMHNGNDVDGHPLMGYRRFVPGEIFQELTPQEIQRGIASGTGNWRPTSWLKGFVTGGVDFTQRLETDLCQNGQCVDFGQTQLGFKSDNRTITTVYTVNSGLTATANLSSALKTETSIGVQYFLRHFSQNQSSGSILAPGSQSDNGASIPTVAEETLNSRTRGEFIEENLSLLDRLFLSAGVRRDENSAFGRDFKSVYYPKASLSYVLSREPALHMPAWIDLLRLRAAYGQSGLQPGATDALQFLTSRADIVNGSTLTGLVDSAVGNPHLEPERTIEFEGGVDFSALHDRLNLDVTYYHKVSHNEIFSAPLPPSVAVLSNGRFSNLGSNLNYGWEAALSGIPIQSPAFSWDLTLKGATNTNTLQDLGNLPPVISGIQRDVVGYPLNGYWAQPILSYNDANHDGILEPSEVHVGPNFVFLGSPVPRDEVTLENGLTFLRGHVRLSGQLDYQGHYKLLNETERIRCNVRLNCSGQYQKGHYFEQARAVALAYDPSATEAGYVENGDFLKLREVSLTLTAPDRWAALMRARSLSVSLSARNLKTWTPYRGLDPETNYIDQANPDVPTDFQTLPPPSFFVVRVNLGF